MRRTDIHAPSSAKFDPAAYAVYDVFDNAPGEDRDFQWALRGLLERGYRWGRGNQYVCGHCGANFRYFALLVREDVKEFIAVGQQCLDNRFRGLTAAGFQALREAARLNRERANAAERIAMLKADHACIARLLDGNEPEVNADGFLTDIRAKALARAG
jgi:hypothetical protein